jgi:hypothetical protein
MIDILFAKVFPVYLKQANSGNFSSETFFGHFVDPCLYFLALFIDRVLHKCFFQNKIGDQSILPLSGLSLRSRMWIDIIDA